MSAGVALCYSVGEYESSVWHLSEHTKKLDVALNNTNRMITRCLISTIIGKIQILSRIALPDIREVAAMVERKKQISDHRHHMFGEVQINNSLKSKKPFIKTSVSIAKILTLQD